MHDWLYSEERLNFRSKCLGILLKEFGWELNENNIPKYDMMAIQGCAHDWVSQGNIDTSGLLDYFISYYHNKY